MGDCYFDELATGYTAHSTSYALTAEEIIAFAQKYDPRPFHIDEEAAARSIFGGLTASSAHIFAIATSLTVELNPWFRVLAAMGFDETRFPNPARPGDRLTFAIEIDNKRVSQSRPDRGIIHCIGRLTNQHGDLVMQRGATILVECKPD